MDNYSDAGDYEVGYGRPPINAMFPKGVSGNPLGRPKNPSDFGAKVVKELNSKLTITENGKRRVMTKDEGLVKQTVNKALAGNLPAMRLVIELRRQQLEKVAYELRLSPPNLVGMDVRDLTTEELYEVILSSAKGNIRAQLEKSVREELRKTVRAELRISMRAEVENSVRADLEKSIRREVEESMRADANGKKRGSRLNTAG